MSNDTKRTIGFIVFGIVFYGAMFALMLLGWKVSDEAQRFYNYSILAIIAITPMAIDLHESIEKRLFPKTKQVRD